MNKGDKGGYVAEIMNKNKFAERHRAKKYKEKTTLLKPSLLSFSPLSSLQKIKTYC